jgi:hypothetical protein
MWLNDFMQRIQIPLFLGTLFMLVYNFSPYMGFSDNVIVSMFLLSPLVVIWMVVRILKDGKPSTKTFTEHFYEDHAYRRAPIRETDAMEP